MHAFIISKHFGKHMHVSKYACTHLSISHGFDSLLTVLDTYYCTYVNVSCKVWESICMKYAILLFAISYYIYLFLKLLRQLTAFKNVLEFTKLKFSKLKGKHHWFSVILSRNPFFSKIGNASFFSFIRHVSVTFYFI